MMIPVTGAAGQLDAVIVRCFGAGNETVSCARIELDITRHAYVMKPVRPWPADRIVNCAAFNDLDGDKERQSLRASFEPDTRHRNQPGC
jgi:dTDP-4-dehydrorhamnose reductase